MKKFFKSLIFCMLTIQLLILTGCADSRKAAAKAIYLSPENGGQLTKEDIEKYPEVVSVTSFDKLKTSVSKNTAIWIDKDTVDSVDINWLQKEAENKLPIVLVGYSSALYSFREKLPAFGIQGPQVDWSSQKLEPGFSVWMSKESTNSSESAFMKGYDSTPDVKQILSVTNMLLEGNYPGVNSSTAGNSTFDETKAISMVVKDHPDFPSNPSGIITKELPTGGPKGTTAKVKFTTEVEKSSDTAYIVTLTKDWGITVNGKYAKSYWKFKVTPDSVNLLESVDNDYLPNTMK